MLDLFFFNIGLLTAFLQGRNLAEVTGTWSNLLHRDPTWAEWSLFCQEICQILMDLKIQPRSLSEQDRGWGNL